MKTNSNIHICLFMSMGICITGFSSQAGDVLLNNLTAVNDITAFGELRVMEGDISTNAPVLYYSFNEAPQSNLVKDDSLQLNTGTSLGAVWTTPGQVGDGAYSFAGTNDYINVNFGSSLELTGPFSLAAWIKPSVAAEPGGPGIITKGANSSSVEYGLMWLHSAGGQVGFYSTGGSSSLWTTNGVVPTGVWTHIVGVLEGSGSGETKLYVNGVLHRTGTLNLPSSLTGDRPLYIGRWRHEYYFKGLIDEAAIFDRALSAEEVGLMYTNGLSSPILSTLLHVSPNDVTISGPLSVGVHSNQLNLAVTGWADIRYIIPHGDISMGIFTNSP